jgi:multidrug resistance efflux pump
MKRFRVILCMLAVAVPLASVANASIATPRVERREARQEMRMAQGIRSGELTRREAVRLERGAARIDRLECRAQADGRVTPRERMHLQRALNHESRRIYRLKHNPRERGW